MRIRNLGIRITAFALAATFAGTTAHVATGALLRPYDGPKSEKIEVYTSYDGQTLCSLGAKPGVRAFEHLLLQKYPETFSMGIKRPCDGNSVSEHKEGRALDWGVNAHNERQRLLAKKMLRWLFETDRFGNTHSRARRLGIMYIIWNKRMWRAYRPFDGWQPYEGNPHTDHMHISFSLLGGRGLTSFWTGKVADLPAAWIPGETDD